MGGKLPIDRARERQHAPRVIEEEKEQFAREQAKLREVAHSPVEEETQPTEEAAEETEHA